MVMQTTLIEMERAEALRLYQEYRQHQQYSDPIDREIARVYHAIAKGRIVIRALESIRVAGLGEDRLPKLAIVRADAKTCWLTGYTDGRARFASKQRVKIPETKSYFDFPADSFPGIKPDWRQHEAMVPLIPVKHRPRMALSEYHILWEAEWRRTVPIDPMLLRRVGTGDVWIVVAAWDLTPVERAVLSSRLNG